VLNTQPDQAHLNTTRYQIFVLDRVKNSRELRAQACSFDLRRMGESADSFAMGVREVDLKLQVLAWI
jgi:hypothetical protein